MLKTDYEKGFKAGYERGWAGCLDTLGARRRKALRLLTTRQLASKQVKEVSKYLAQRGYGQMDKKV